MQNTMIYALGLMGLGWALGMAPGLAHQVQIQADVGATLHIEPNDLPRAGAPSTVWFALTQPGGRVIPLAACDCTLTLTTDGAGAIATPPLTPLSAEGYANIPSATVTFPDVGAYQLVLTGVPQSGVQFEPFTLTFEVTVADRVTPKRDAPVKVEESAPARPATIAPRPETPAPLAASKGGWAVALIGGALLAGAIGWRYLSRRASRGGKG
ncbi:MAG TPA: hypothetical protein V6D02_13870 [Candidatus Obscuribacterales bacterium]